jgi:hypothetical protein
MEEIMQYKPNWHKNVVYIVTFLVKSFRKQDEQINCYNMS